MLTDLREEEVVEIRNFLSEREAQRRAALSPVERAIEDYDSESPRSIVRLIEAVEEQERAERRADLVPKLIGGAALVGLIGAEVLAIRAALKAPRTRRGAIMRAAIKWLTR